MTGKIRHFYEGIIGFGEFLSHYLLLALRLYWGYAFFMAGYGKFESIEKIVTFFESLNIPLPFINAYLVAGFEMICGLFLIFGLASRLVAIPLIIIMVIALLTAHSEATFDLINKPQKFINQSPFNYLLMSLVVLCFGPGKISLDYLFKRFLFKSK